MFIIFISHCTIIQCIIRFNFKAFFWSNLIHKYQIIGYIFRCYDPKVKKDMADDSLITLLKTRFMGIAFY